MAPTGKDIEVFDMHQHMKLIAPESGRAADQQSTDSAGIRKGKHPFLGSWWALAWKLVKEELQHTYGEKPRSLPNGRPMKMMELYSKLFGSYQVRLTGGRQGTPGGMAKLQGLRDRPRAISRRNDESCRDYEDQPARKIESRKIGVDHERLPDHMEACSLGME